MTENEIDKDLSEIKSEDDLIDRAGALVEKWNAQHVGFFAVKPILLFMEANPKWDFGMPGAFVHFVENFYHNGYEEALIASIERRPIPHTVWMLNRIINGESDSLKRGNYINFLKSVKNHNSIDDLTVSLIDEFLELHGVK